MSEPVTGLLTFVIVGGLLWLWLWWKYGRDPGDPLP